MMPIEKKKGVCMDRACYSRKSLARWLGTKPALPHNRAEATPSDLDVAMVTHAPPGSGCTKRRSTRPLWLRKQITKLLGATQEQLDTARANRNLIVSAINATPDTPRGWTETYRLRRKLCDYILLGDGVVILPWYAVDLRNSLTRGLYIPRLPPSVLSKYMVVLNTAFEPQ